MLKGWNRIAVVATVLLAAFLCKDILAGQATVDWVEERNPTNSLNKVTEQGDTGKPSKEEFIQKTQTLRMPFIANNGQMDEQVRFYAKTFGGTVFVTKEGEIVYSLPSGRDVPAGASQESPESQQSEKCLKHGGIGAVVQGGMVVLGWQGQAVLVRAESEVTANGYASFLRADKAQCPQYRVLTNTLLATYFPALQGSTGKIVGTRCPCPPPLAYLSRLQKSTDKQDMSMPPTAIQNPQSPTKGVALKEHLVGGKANEIQGAVQSVTTVSYFKGNDPSKWKSNISTYEVVDMGEVYDGIGLRLKAYSNNVEKLFTVTPEANPEAIKVGLSGATALRVNEDGQLEAETELGPVKFTKPVAYQEIGGKRVEVAVEYTIYGSEIDGMEGRGAGEQGCRGELETINSKPETENPKSETRNSKLTYGFTVVSYDKTQDLIIDPLLASTFLGGSSEESGNALVLDTSGNVYVMGDTYSTDFPTTSGAYDTSNGGIDVFVSKLNSELTSLLASTFLGGSSQESGESLALDTSGNVYVTGLTYSANFPTTSGAYDTSQNGIYSDVFVSKLDSGLTGLLASTFLGGSDTDRGTSLSLDTSGNVYVTGLTYSANFPTTSGAYDTSFYGYSDVFVSKLNSGLTSLLASTYLGGSSQESGNSLTLDTSGNVYVTGDTWSTDFPTTSGAYDTSFNGGSVDVFVSKLNSGLTSLLASTYLGGSGGDGGSSLTLDISGNVYVTGYTYSTDFPTTSGAYDTSYNGKWDVFVSKLDSRLTSLLASTYLGGSRNETGSSLTLDTSGNVYVTGETQSLDFPTTSGAYDTSYDGIVDMYDYSDPDVFASKLNSGLTSLLASTYLGGSGGDGGSSLTLDTSGNVYVTGYTRSSNFPTTSGAYDTSFNGGDDFISKLDGNLSAVSLCKAKAIIAAPKKLTLRKNGNGDVTITVKGDGNCLVEGVTVTATISGNGSDLIAVTPGSQETDANGQAMFAIDAKNKKGTAVIRFRANGLSRSATAQVKVR